MRLGHLVVLSALLVTKAAANCDKEDCETGLSVGYAAATTCASVGGALCFAAGWATFGLTCAVGLGCGVAAGVAGASKEACRACGDGGGGGIDVDRLSGEIKANTDRLISKINILTLSVENVLDQSIKIEGDIQLSHIIALYGQDITNYQKIRRVFKRLRKNSNGLIMRNSDSIRFARAANDPIDGLLASSLQIFQMMTGGHPLKSESIFQAVPDFCHNGSKNYFLKIMFDCYILESVARAMSGESMNPSRVQEFKREVIEIEDQFLKSCGCPAHLVKSIRQPGLLSALESQARSLPAGHCIAKETYLGQPIPSFIMDDSTDRLTLQKITLLYSIAPFSAAKSAAAKATAEKYRMEEIELAQYLSMSGSLADLTLYENSLFCARYTSGLPTPAPTPAPIPAALTPSGVFKLHSDSQFEYFKVAVNSGVTMVEGATVTACRKYGLEAACSGPRGCQWNDETKCQVVPIETECDGTMRGLSQAVCDGEWNAQKCAELEGVFQYYKGFYGGDYGVVGGSWVYGKDHASGDGGKTTFAYCVKAR